MSYTRRKVLILTLDGTGPEYLEAADTPNLRALSEEGFWKTGRCVMPSVTNVNNVSIATGCFPLEHGISSNYWFDPESKQGQFIETAELLRVPTILDRARASGFSTALVVSKKKLLGLLGRGAQVTISAESAPSEWTSKVGAVPPIYSGEVNIWLLRACYSVLRDLDPGIVYCSTTDYLQHHYGPDHEVMRHHLGEVDLWIGEIASLDPQREIYVTADHGMNRKPRIVNLQLLLDQAGLRATCVPVIKDRYLAHHPHQEGGSVYVYLDRGSDMKVVRQWLEQTLVVDSVYSRYEAVERFRLPGDRIGDLFVLASQDVAFGEQAEVELKGCGRSHGSLYEVDVPIIAYHPTLPCQDYSYNLDVVRNLGI
jgi:phosphonoacetate hydrolase